MQTRPDKAEYKSRKQPSELLLHAINYPMIHRVFTKKPTGQESGNSQDLKTLEKESTVRYRPRPPTVMDLLLNQNYWTGELWIVLLIECYQYNGFSALHSPKGSKLNFKFGDYFEGASAGGSEDGI